MKDLIKKFMAGVSFTLVFCLHIYFALLVGTKPALAAEEATNTSTVKVESSGGAFKIKVADKNNTETVTENADENSEESAVAAGAGDEADSGDEDSKFSLNIDGKNGIVINGKGAEKLVAKLKKLEDKFDDKMSDREVVAGMMGNTLGKTLEIVLVPIMIFLITFGFAGYVVYSRQKTRRDTLDTIRALAQNNQPIPPELLANLQPKNSDVLGTKWNPAYGDVNSLQGIKYVFIGIGVVGCMVLLDRGHVGGALGMIFIAVGAYHIVKAQLIQKAKLAHTTAEGAAPVVPTVTTTTTPSNPA